MVTEMTPAHRMRPNSSIQPGNRHSRDAFQSVAANAHEPVGSQQPASDEPGTSGTAYSNNTLNVWTTGEAQCIVLADVHLIRHPDNYLFLL